MKEFLFLIIFALVLINGAAAQDEKTLLSGSEPPQANQITDTTKCYVFGKYVVKTVLGGDVGEDIEIFRRTTTADVEAGCQTSGKSYLSIKNPDANYFIGVAGTFLFIDSGTSVESRGLEIYNLTTRKSVFKSEYHEVIKLKQNKFLIYDKPSTQKGNLRTCKDAARWKREGLSVGWVQSRQLDLQTLKETSVGSLRCVAQQ